MFGSEALWYEGFACNLALQSTAGVGLITPWPRSRIRSPIAGFFHSTLRDLPPDLPPAGLLCLLCWDNLLPAACTRPKPPGHRYHQSLRLGRGDISACCCRMLRSCRLVGLARTDTVVAAVDTEKGLTEKNRSLQCTGL